MEDCDLDIDLAEKALALSSVIDRAASRSAVMSRIASVFLAQGDKTRGLDTLDRAEKAADLVRMPGEKALLLISLGEIYQQADLTQKAAELFERARLLAGAEESPTQKTSVLSCLVSQYLENGLTEKASSILGILIDIVDAEKDNLDYAWELLNIVQLFIDMQNREKAMETLEKVHGIALSIQDTWFKSERLMDIAGYFLELEEAARALATLDEVSPRILQLPESERIQFRLSAVDILDAAGEKKLLFTILETALGEAEKIDNSFSACDARLEIAGKYHDQDKQQAAVEVLAAVEEKLQKMEDFKDRIHLFLEIGGLWKDWAVKENALETCEKISALLEQAPQKKDTLFLSGKLAVLSAGLGLREKSSLIALTMQSLVKEYRLKTSGLGALAVELAEAGDTESALLLAGLISDKYIAADTLVSLSVLE